MSVLNNLFEIGNLIFMAEILVAEMIFLYACPKRKLFVVRYIAAVALCFLLAYFFPMPRAIRYNVWFLLLRFIALFAYTVVAMGFCFKLNIPSLLTSCVAGYAVQHIAYQITTIFSNLTPLFEGWKNRSNLCDVVIFPFVSAAMFFLFGLSAAKNESYKNKDWRLIAISVVTIFICVVLMRFSRKDGFSVSNCLYSITCCLLALFIQYNLRRMFELKNENEAIKIIWKEEKKQYEISKSTIDLVNIKYHDLKRRLDSVHGLTREETDSLRDTLQLYSGSFRTGSEVLDVILTENSLRHRDEGIDFTFMGNGEQLSFMSVTDIYSLFGNALENAVEAVRGLTIPEKKTISITLEEKGDMLAVSVTNYFAGGDLKYLNGLPVTSKTAEEGYHGFGMKSIKLISEKYCGDMRVDTQGDLFTLNVYLMK